MKAAASATPPVRTSVLMFSHLVRQHLGSHDTKEQLGIAAGLGLLLGSLSLALSPLKVLALLLGGLLLIAALKWPVLSLLGIIIGLSTIVPEHMIPVINVGPGRLLATDVLLVLPLAQIIVRWIVEPDFKLVRPSLTVPFGIFFGAALLSTLIALTSGTVDIKTVIPEVRTLSYYLTLFIVANLMRHEKQLMALLKGFFTVTAVTAFASLLQFILGDSVVILPGRVESLNTMQEDFAGVTRILIPGQALMPVTFLVSSALLVMQWPGRSRLLLLVWGLSGIGLALTFTRSYWISVLIGQMIMAVLIGTPGRQRLTRNLTRALPLIVVFLLTVTVFVAQPEPNRVATLIDAALGRFYSATSTQALSDPSLHYRSIENEYALDRLREEPFLLLGLGMGASYRPLDSRLDYEQADGTIVDGSRYIHQGHLGVMLKGGLISYSGFVWLSILFLWRSFRHWRGIPNPAIRGAVLGFALSFLLILMSSFTSPLLLESFWVPVCGLILGFNEAAFAVFKPARAATASVEVRPDEKKILATSERRTMPDVSVIIVSYNSADLLRRCLHSVMAETPNLMLEMIIIDNASNDYSCEMLREEFAQLRLIANETNYGFSKAVNQGLRASSGRYVLLLNPDTEIRDRSIERMVEFLDANPRIGACGSKLYFADGTYQRSALPLPTLLSVFYEYSALFERLPIVARLLKPKWIDRPGETRPVGYCSGACFLVSRECLNEVGLMDEAFFLYGEDVDWCRRMWEASCPVYFFAQSRAIHYEGGSQGINSTRRLRELKGEMQYLRKWHGALYTWGYLLLARLLSAYRYVVFRYRRYRNPENAELLSDFIEFYRAVLIGRLDATREPEPNHRRKW